MTASRCLAWPGARLPPLPRLARVLVTRRLPERGLDPLLAAGHEIVQRPGDDAYSPAELAAASDLFSVGH